MSHYSRADCVRALEEAGVRRGDLVFSHSNIGYFGRPAEGDPCGTLLSAFREVLGSTGTLALPVYTSSFTRHEVFSPERSPSTCGVFTEWFRQQPDVLRSADPMLSVAAQGPLARDLTADPPENSFAPESFFGRLYEAGGRIVNLNFDAGSTYLHYVERCLGVPYRYDKVYRGYVEGRGVVSSIQFSRDLANAATVTAFEPYDRWVRSQGLVTRVRLGRGAVESLTARDAFDALRTGIAQDPWLMTVSSGQALDVPLVRWAAPGAGALATVSPAMDRLILDFAGQHGLAVEMIPTGTRLGQWLVPEGWLLEECDVDPSLVVPYSRSYTGPVAPLPLGEEEPGLPPPGGVGLRLLPPGKEEIRLVTRTYRGALLVARSEGEGPLGWLSVEDGLEPAAAWLAAGGRLLVGPRALGPAAAAARGWVSGRVRLLSAGRIDRLVFEGLGCEVEGGVDD